MRVRILVLLVASYFASAVCLRATPVFGNAPANPVTNVIAIPPGLSTIANPLNHYRGQRVRDAILDNSVAAVLPVVPIGTVLYKFDFNRGEWSVNIFHRSGWSDPSATLALG